MTRKQLLALGLDDHGIGWRTRHGRLFRVHHGVYAVGRPPVAPPERAAAAVLACGPGAALSHGSAMTLWGFWKHWDRPFEVTVPGDRRPRRIRTHRTRPLHHRDVRRQLDVPVTSPARTLLDMAARLKPAALRRAVKDGQARKLASQEALAEVLAHHPHHPGAAKLRPYLDDPDDTRSILEDRFLDFCQRAGIQRPRMNVEVCGFLVDALFEPEKVIVELDSWDVHANREAFEDDRERDGVTTEAGLITVRITSRGFEHQAQRLQKILASPPAPIRLAARMSNPQITPDSVTRALEGSFPGSLGMEPLEVEDRLVTGRMRVDRRHLHPGGYVHGGVWVAFADSVAAWGTMRNLPPDHNFTTVELKVNVFAAARDGDELIGRGEPLHLGKRTQVWEVRVENGGRLAANFICTQMILRTASRGGAR